MFLLQSRGLQIYLCQSEEWGQWEGSEVSAVLEDLVQFSTHTQGLIFCSHSPRGSDALLLVSKGNGHTGIAQFK